jgi:hypothetical protein
VGFVVDNVALGQAFLRVLWFSPVNIIPQLLHIHTCVIWGWTMSPLVVHFHRDTGSPHRNNKKYNIRMATKLERKDLISSSLVVPKKNKLWMDDDYCELKAERVNIEFKVV